MRHDNRRADELRPIEIKRPFTNSSPGSVYIKAGSTTVLCSASVENDVPPWKKSDENPSGWVTAEYSMLPGSTSPRKRRERNKVDSRSTEIQRLIGRSLRAVIDFDALGPRTIHIDCDVLEADGGTRTLSITGGFIALVDAVFSIAEVDPEFDPRKVFNSGIAAISVGLFEGEALLDLDYHEDSRADVDMNFVMTAHGKFVEVQGTAESHPFDHDQLRELLMLAENGIRQLSDLQRKTLAEKWPLDEVL